jgi:hypothetical protein
MPPLPHAEREPELDNLRSVTRITGTVLNRSDSAICANCAPPGPYAPSLSVTADTARLDRLSTGSTGGRMP